MRRRTLFSLLPLAALVACSSTKSKESVVSSVAVVTQDTVNDIKLLTAAFAPLALVVAASVGVSLETANEILGYVQDIEDAAAKVAPGIAVAVAQPSVKAIIHAVEAIVDALVAYKMPDKVAKLLAAAQKLLPLIEVGVELSSVLPSLATPNGLTVDDARAVLAEGIR